MARSTLRFLLAVTLVAATFGGPAGAATGTTSAWSAPAPTSATATTGPLRPGAVVPAPTDAWIDAAHRALLGRAATGADVTAWRTTVHRHGPGALAGALATSDEWAGTRVAGLYRSILGRDAEDRGRAYWVERIRAGSTLEMVAAGFHGSDERFARLGRDVSVYVDALYDQILRRRADDRGRAHWISAIDDGTTTRAGAAAAFLDSVESRTDRVDALFAELLGRSPEPRGRAHWVGVLPRLGDVALAASLVASDEFHRRATGIDLPHVALEAVGPGTRFPLDASWRPGCPVPPTDLVAVTFDHHTFDARPGRSDTARGVLIVHRDVAGDVAAAVRAAFGGGFPIRQARPVDDFGGDDDASMAADNTSAFNCRTVAGTGTWSRHAHGTAVDWNPVENPYVRGDRVDPPTGAAHRDRDDVRPGMLVAGGPVIEVFDDLGWGWGGRWRSAQDFQHVSRDGR